MIPLPRRAGRRWHIVWHGLRLGLVVETANFVATDAFSTIFLLFVPCFLLFSSPSISRYVYLFHVPSSVQLSSNTTLSKYVVRFLYFCVICKLPHLGIPFFCLFSIFRRLVPFSRMVFLLCSCTMYVVNTWSAYFGSSATLLFSLSHCLWPQKNLYVYL